MGESRVHDALAALAARLDELDIPYAILGALALNAYGYLRATVDVDVLLTRQGLERFRAAALGHGYLEKFPGSRPTSSVRPSLCCWARRRRTRSSSERVRPRTSSSVMKCTPTPSSTEWRVTMFG